jgi:light-regulated signal transduction histidine kinase (bacteriophytochrome)
MILIVDDKRENIIPLKKILELHNLESDAAGSGEEALKKVLKYDYSLIIMDVQMPGMDGFEVVETLAGSNRAKDIPVIFLSAISKEKKYISRGYETGAVDYITKPVDPDLFILKVKAFLKLYEQQQELKNIQQLLAKEIEIRKAAQEEQKRANDNLEIKVAQRTHELSTKNEELELRNHELQQFTWVVSHDLKEPLRKIETFTRMIKDRFLPNDDKAAAYMDRTINAAARMTLLIDDLLDYSRLSSNVIPEKTDLNAIVSGVFSDFDHLIEEKKAVVKMSPLPQIMGVPSQLRQLFQNIIGNALKFSGGTMPATVIVAAEIIENKELDSHVSPLGKFVRLTISDNGIGFDEQYLEKIFVIFQRLHSRESFEGTGIGLAIAKKIVEKHNGLITARSPGENGATFIIVLPL